METNTIQAFTFDTFDLIDIQRARYPNLNTYSYVSKALNVKSRLNFILIAKNLSKFVKSTGIKASIAPDHKTVYRCLSWPNNSPRGPGFWKFNNTLLKDENYTGEICELIPRICEKYESLKDKRLVWELQLKWLNQPVKILGIYFSYDENKNKHLNFD